mmetsp:Transcript_61022/g.159837  ORF Transcript_61022/g.159837 Transcript_61022/m.159837 type:complete len:225 (+) Transcript_61022:395-1069(+)
MAKAPQFSTAERRVSVCIVCSSSKSSCSFSNLPSLIRKLRFWACASTSSSCSDRLSLSFISRSSSNLFASTCASTARAKACASAFSRLPWRTLWSMAAAAICRSRREASRSSQCAVLVDMAITARSRSNPRHCCCKSSHSLAFSSSRNSQAANCSLNDLLPPSNFEHVLMSSASLSLVSASSRVTFFFRCSTTFAMTAVARAWNKHAGKNGRPVGAMGLDDAFP